MKARKVAFLDAEHPPTSMERSYANPAPKVNPVSSHNAYLLSLPKIVDTHP